MISIETRYGIADVSDEFLKFYQEQSTKPETAKLLDSAGVNPNLEDRIRALVGIEIHCFSLFVKRQGYSRPESPRLLVAHGVRGRRLCYMYQDRPDSQYPVDGWLDEHDGLHDALYLACCNTTSNGSYWELEPRKSLIVYPQGALTSREVLLIPVVPGSLTLLPSRYYKPQNPNLRVVK